MIRLGPALNYRRPTEQRVDGACYTCADEVDPWRPGVIRLTGLVDRLTRELRDDRSIPDSARCMALMVMKYGVPPAVAAAIRSEDLGSDPMKPVISLSNGRMLQPDPVDLERIDRLSIMTAAGAVLFGPAAATALRTALHRVAAKSTTLEDLRLAGRIVTSGQPVFNFDLGFRDEPAMVAELIDGVMEHCKHRRMPNMVYAQNGIDLLKAGLLTRIDRKVLVRVNVTKDFKDRFKLASRKSPWHENINKKVRFTSNSMKAFIDDIEYDDMLSWQTTSRHDGLMVYVHLTPEDFARLVILHLSATNLSITALCKAGITRAVDALVPPTGGTRPTRRSTISEEVRPMAA